MKASFPSMLSLKCVQKLRIRRQANLSNKMIETVAGRVIFNQYVPEEVGFVDELLTKKKLQTIIADVFKASRSIQRQLNSLMILKNLDSRWPSKVVCPWDLNDVKVPDEKEKLVANAQEEVDECMEQLHDGSYYRQRTLQPGN